MVVFIPFDANASSTFKCEGIDGHITYSDTECNESIALPIEGNLSVVYGTGLRPLETHMLLQFDLRRNIEAATRSGNTVLVIDLLGAEKVSK